MAAAHAAAVQKFTTRCDSLEDTNKKTSDALAEMTIVRNDAEERATAVGVTLRASQADALALRLRMDEFQAAHAAGLKEQSARYDALQLVRKELCDALAQMTVGRKDAEGRAVVVGESLMGKEAETVALGIRIAQLTAQNECLSSHLSAANTRLGGLQGNISQLSLQDSEKDQLLVKGERERRKLHNQLDELRGNIRVYCRVRPNFGAGVAPAQIEYPDKLDHRLLEIKQGRDNATSTGRQEKALKFNFDTVFPPETTQQDVFERVGPLVDSVLDGYKVCVFAYGQTGSGKTHTMEGGPDEGSQGLIPRAIAQLFESAEKLKTSYSWSFTVSCTYVEIYNDDIRDLLTDSDAVLEHGETKHEIRHEGKSDTTVTGVREMTVHAPCDVQEVLTIAGKNRSTARTKLNDRSSRSHSVFTMKMDGVNTMIGTKTSGVLCLIDLAGSERPVESGATGSRFKEAVAINKSLSHLGDVIAALGSENGHIPFRNCKLTYLLQNYLGGDACKMLMLVNVSPAEDHVCESVSSLRFAAKVNSTVIGTAKKRIS